MASAIDTIHHIVTILVQDMIKGFPGVFCVLNSLIKKIFSFHQVIGNCVHVVKHQ